MYTFVLSVSIYLDLYRYVYLQLFISMANK